MTDKQFEYELARLQHPAGQAMRAKENDPETALARAVGVLTERESRTTKLGFANEEMTVGEILGALSIGAMVLVAFMLGLMVREWVG